MNYVLVHVLLVLLLGDAGVLDKFRSVAPRFFIKLYGIDASDPDVGFLHVTLKVRKHECS